MSAVGSTGIAINVTMPWMESFPDQVLAALEARDRAWRREAKGITTFGQQFVLLQRTLWPASATVHVAFRGGSPELYDKIANTAEAWNGHGSVNLSFRDDVTKPYRVWSPTDTKYAAEVRVAFDATGYWSHVGRDNVDPAVAPPGQSSLNLAGFDQELPLNWAAVVLHEFGHALGFQHEHQNPTGGCDTEFQWEDRDNGQPGIYALLGGAPNYWPRAKVDQNLRSLPPNAGYAALGPRDRSSVMHYHFPTEMFARGANSPCWVPENGVLSTGDKEGLSEAYPIEPERLKRLRAAIKASFDALESETRGRPSLEAFAKNMRLVREAKETIR